MTKPQVQLRTISYAQHEEYQAKNFNSKQTTVTLGRTIRNPGILAFNRQRQAPTTVRLEDSRYLRFVRQPKFLPDPYIKTSLPATHEFLNALLTIQYMASKAIIESRSSQDTYAHRRRRPSL